MAFVDFQHVDKVYSMGEVRIEALRDVTFSIERGEICVIVGASGAGKTTLLNILGGMDSLSAGTVLLDGEDWADLLSDPAAKTKYAAQIVIDGETFPDVTFSTKGFSSLYFVAYGEEESRRYSFKVKFGEQDENQSYYGLDSLSLNSLFCDNTWMKDLICYDLFRDAGVEAPWSAMSG